MESSQTRSAHTKQIAREKRLEQERVAKRLMEWFILGRAK